MNSLKILSSPAIFIFLLAGFAIPSPAAIPEGEICSVNVVWNVSGQEGKVVANPGRVSLEGKGKIRENSFSFRGKDEARLKVTVSDALLDRGAGATIVRIEGTKNPFSFLLRDVTSEAPIFIPDFGVAVVPAEDTRSYAEIAQSVRSKGLKTKVQKIEEEPEASFDTFASQTRFMRSPILLGIGNDVRIFQIQDEVTSRGGDGDLKTISLLNHIYNTTFAGRDLSYGYLLGRGIGPDDNLRRSLDEGCLPIYHSDIKDDDVAYNTVMFASLESSPLTKENVEGTAWETSDCYGWGRGFSKEKVIKIKTEYENWQDSHEGIVLYSRTKITNTGEVPRYAFIKNVYPNIGNEVGKYDPKTGFFSVGADTVLCITMLDGNPMPGRELSFVLQPGQTAYYDFYIPHRSISKERAEALSEVSIPEKLSEARKFWHEKLNSGGSIHVPDKRIEEMIKAGLLHLNLITFGKEPDGTLAPDVGIYTPIGTESSPIMQFYMSMGWTDIARRCLMYFMETQQDNGYIANYEGYCVETGAALWSIGEYYRYTHDDEFIRKIMPKLVKSCDYQTQWRNKSKKEELRGIGYGMIDGKVADPNDYYFQFMLNAYGYLGQERMGEVLKAVGSPDADRIAKDAASWKEDIRETFFNVTEKSPVMPLGDGTWVPSTPPWANIQYPRFLSLDGQAYFSHGTFTVPDGLLGPLYLIFGEVLDPYEPAARHLLDYHREILLQGNAGFSQPYYCRHNSIQAIMGEVKPFLSTYFHTMSAQADRETYTFWEHDFKVSIHKTHEEGWFLMETRQMLWLERGDTLSLFRTAPASWFEKGKKIELDNVLSYFGKLSADVSAGSDGRSYEINVSMGSSKLPKVLAIRIPCQEGSTPVIAGCNSCTYDSDKETLVINNPESRVNLSVRF